MRETLIKEGIQDRLSNLLGDGNSVYSMQASSGEDLKRIHYSILGDSQYGRVMTGLDVSTSGTKVLVGSGYGITIGGNLIKFGKQYESAPTAIQNSPGKTYYIYANYEVAERNDDQGGKTMNILNTLTPQPIIRDQIGASGEDLPGQYIVTAEDAAATAIAVSATKLYIGTIQFTDETPGGLITRVSDNEGIAYTYSKDVLTPIFSDSMTYTANRKESQVLLDSGRNRLKEFNIIRYHESLTVERATDATYTTLEEFYVHVNIQGLNNDGAVEQEIAPDLILTDIYSNFGVNRFSIEEVISENVVALRISTSIGVDATGLTTSYFTTTYSTPALMSYVIERLT